LQNLKSKKNLFIYSERFFLVDGGGGGLGPFFAGRLVRVVPDPPGLASYGLDSIFARVRNATRRVVGDVVQSNALRNPRERYDENIIRFSLRKKTKV
jgi:hypothetical protein